MLASQRKELEDIKAQLDNSLLKTDNKREVRTAVRQVKELTTSFKQDKMEPNAIADMDFSVSANVTEDCENYGMVTTLNSMDPSRCYATSVEVAIVGEKSSTFLQTLNFRGHPYVGPINLISCELMSERTGTRTRCSVQQKRDDQYEILYEPTTKGKHQLHIKVEGQHIRGSPYLISAVKPVEKLGTQMMNISGLNKPVGIAVTVKGEVIVTEYGRHCVSVFSLNGERLQQFGSHGSGRGEFKRPHGLTVDSEGNILVCDNANHRIQKFTVHGELLKTVGCEGHSGPLHFYYPHGIAFNPKNGRVYVGSWNDCIQILNPDLSYFDTFGKRGSEKGQFDNPKHISCDSTGNIYVADYNNYRIQVFTADGVYLRSIGKPGEGKGELTRPHDVAVDPSGRVYVSEADLHRISVFTTEGQFLASFGNEGSRPGQFNGPRGIAIDNSGVLYVCDTYNNRVQLF